MVEHWDGTSWTRTSTPGLDSGDSFLTAVSATSADDVWAVGYTESVLPDSHPVGLVLHWDGTSWARTFVPKAPGTVQQVFDGVAALSTHNVWAVGNDYVDALLEHWDGRAWTESESPAHPPYVSDGLRGVSAAASDDVWAVGAQSGTHPGLSTT